MLSSTRHLEDLLPDIQFPEGPQSLVHRWREVAAAVPDVVAFLDDGNESRPGTSYTFAEADRLSDLVAMALVAAIGDSEVPLAALLGHDANAAIAQMALLKTGRIRVVLDTRLSLDALLAEATRSTETPQEIAHRVSTELALGESRGGTDEFEIVFTSGSTGTPKGVLQRHNSFLNDYVSYKDIRNVPVGSPVAVVLPMSFVAGSGCLLTTVLGGATACLIDPRDTGVPELVGFLKEHRVTGLDCTPHLIRGIVAELDDGEILPDLRFIGTLGEAIHRRDLQSILSHLGPDSLIVNEVGASEINSLATYVVRQGDEIPEGNLPAGLIFPAKTVRLVDENGHEVPEGETGELIVVSEFLSGGYWKNDEQNAEKFGIDEDGREFVRQGDLARIRADGVLQLLGRANGGVKVRGYLVEPSEIEGALVSLDDIEEAVVTAVVTEGRPTRLVAYVVPRRGLRPPSNPALRRSLRAVLPEYMVPSEILQLAEMPRTERGKVDRKALPPVPEHVVDVYEMNQRELAMSTIWQDVLELPAVGREDDFMALGGDSLSAEELLTQVKEHFGVEVASTDILSHPTLHEFTQHVLSGASGKANETDHVLFNRNAQGTPYFAFAGAGALALTYLPLSKHLSGHPFYAFQQHGLERRALPDRSIEASVTRHLETIRTAQPHGPYRLMGHSFGGILAIEAARRLQEAGETVERLVILDTYLPQNVAGATASDVEAEYARLARPRNLRKRFLPDGLPDRAHLGRQIRARFAGVWRHAGLRQYETFYDLSILMMRRFVLTPYSGPAVLVIADENPDGAIAWNETLTGERADVVMTAEHTSILREPHVATLAAEVLPHLE